MTTPQFQREWRGKTLADLTDYISGAMPPAAPRSLSAKEYASVARYIAVSTGTINPDAHDGRAVNESNKPEAGIDATALAASHSMIALADKTVFADAPYKRSIAERQKTLADLSPVTDAMLRDPSPSDWLHWRRTYGQSGHSPLQSVNRDTVRQLNIAWAWSLPAGLNEITPLVHDGVMFINSVNDIQALDAATGTLLWRYQRKVKEGRPLGAIGIQRNFAIYGTNLYIATIDRCVIALDIKTGRLVWETDVIPPDAVATAMTAGPTVANGMVLQGISVGASCRGGCAIVGLDAMTGEKKWQFNTVEQPNRAARDTWNHAPRQDRTGGAVWVTGSFSPETNLAYFGTGSSYFAKPLLDGASTHSARNERSDALYTDSTVALEPATGKLAWYHQHLPRDVWDMDEAFERLLITLSVGGTERSLLLTTGKLGIIDALDRQSGAHVFSIDLGLQNLVKSIDPKTGQRTIDLRLKPVAGTTYEVCPSSEGARNWMSASYNSTTQHLFLPMEETCMDYVWRPGASNDRDALRIDIGWSLKPVPHSDGNYGRLQAVDMTSRKPIWNVRTRAPLASSLLSTEGGVLFVGDRDRMFRSIDDRNGATLWETRLNAVPNSSPITYSVNGRQYIAVVAGGGGPHDAESWEITPEIVNSTASTTLWVFALPASSSSSEDASR